MRALRLLWGRFRNVPGLGRDVIIVVILVAVGVATGAYILSQYGLKPPWEERYTFSADFAEAPGVRPESRQEVRIAGVPVGQIESAEPQPEGGARLEMSLESGHTVYSNAHLVLRTRSPLNVMYVTLDPGEPPAEPLPEGDTIPVSQTERPIQPNEVLDKLDERTRSAATSLLNQTDVALANAPAQLPAGLEATDDALGSFQLVMGQLQDRRATIEKLVTAVSQIATAVGEDDERLAQLMSSLQETLTVLGSRDEELGETLEQFPGFVGDLDNAMNSTGELTEQLDPTLDSLHEASDELPSTLARLTDTVDNAGGLIEEATPVVAKAKPVVADLRPLSADVDTALGELAPTTAHLPSATRQIVPWMDDLAAFVYQTSSSFSLSDANGGLGRANITLDITNPSGGLGPIDGTGQIGGGE